MPAAGCDHRGAGLRQGSREAVQDVPAARGRLDDGRGQRIEHDLVGDEITAGLVGGDLVVADILDAVAGGGPGQVATPAEGLSPSELRVLRYLPTNLTGPEIAGELSISPNTVNTHIRRGYAKLGATDRSSAVQHGRELRLPSSGRA